MPVPVSDEIGARCRCESCPSYHGNEPWLYCGRGKSKSEVTQIQCLCPECPVYAEYKLIGIYYCIEGVAD